MTNQCHKDFTNEFLCPWNRYLQMDATVSNRCRLQQLAYCGVFMWLNTRAICPSAPRSHAWRSSSWQPPDRLSPRRIRRRSLRPGGRRFLRMRAGSTAQRHSWPKFAWQNHHLSYTTYHAFVSGPTRLPRAVQTQTFHA